MSHVPHSAGLSIRVNGEPHTLSPGDSLAELIEGLGLGGRKLAIAVNRDIVPRASYGRELATGDRIEILEAVGGG